jgi:hypothetical protein
VTPRVADIGFVQEEGCYGLFPAFLPRLSRDVMRRAVRTLRAVTREEMGRFVEEIPRAWDVSRTTRDALLEYLFRRAAFVADHIEGWIWRQRELDFPPPEEETP